MVARAAANAARAAEWPADSAHGNSAITVSPPIMVWPTTTSGRTPCGRYRSVRLPKRMIPNRPPPTSVSPTFASHRMRRAISPAICTTAKSRPSGRRRASALRSFRSLALSRLALTKAPLTIGDLRHDRRRRHPVDVDVQDGEEGGHPPARLGSRAPAPPAATASITDTTRPSAGDSMAPGRPGGVRSGSRKKYRQNRVNIAPSPGQPSRQEEPDDENDDPAGDERIAGAMRWERKRCGVSGPGSLEKMYGPGSIARQAQCAAASVGVGAPASRKTWPG